MLADSPQPNKPLERPGMNRLGERESACAGRSAPSRYAHHGGDSRTDASAGDLETLCL
jgi:hypothetical protein